MAYIDTNLEDYTNREQQCLMRFDFVFNYYNTMSFQCIELYTVLCRVSIPSVRLRSSWPTPTPISHPAFHFSC